MAGTYETVLVATDGSAAAEAAVERAVDLADTYGASLHVLYVVDTAALGSTDVRSEVLLDSLTEEGERVTGDAVAVAEEAGVPTETAVVHGSPSKGIVEYAEENDVDLVVVGTHGRRGLDRVLLGSVAERVVRTCPVPVLTVHAPADAEKTERAADGGRTTGETAGERDAGEAAGEEATGGTAGDGRPGES